ncbi:MAG: DICT sensory domain-containing protein [Solirubrobacteraceae bacterium]|nr:DICT sensory domain-containing protein [Solirubrobacteraceae bacterium]
MTTPVTDMLKIKDVAERTGVAAATIRMWEQRYGFPEPDRTPAGYRLYTEADVEAIRTVVALRRRGLSVPAAIERARATPGSDLSRDSGAPLADDLHPSIYAAVAAIDPNAHPRVLRRSTLAAMSHAIEDELLARGASGLVFGAFQRELFYDRVAHRYDQLAMRSEAVVVFADFDHVTDERGAPTRVPIAPTDALGNEWAVVIDAPGYAASLLAWERPNRASGGERLFEAVLSLDPRAARRAAVVAAQLARRGGAEVGDRLVTLLEGRPLATEPPASALTSLTNRMVAYLDDGGAVPG